jgi:predicted HicB family RNase H-like nuclease
MARSFTNLSNSFSTSLELRIERLERTCNGLEARLISLTTLIRAQINKDEPSEGCFERIEKKMIKIQENDDFFAGKLENIEKRLEMLEKKLVSGELKKNFEETHEKIKVCMNDLKENLKSKEKEFSSRFQQEVHQLKEGLKQEYKDLQLKKPSNPQKNDEIDNIIKELQERIKKKSPCRSESFSVIRNKSSTPREEKKGKNKSKRSKKLKQ